MFPSETEKVKSYPGVKFGNQAREEILSKPRCKIHYIYIGYFTSRLYQNQPRKGILSKPSCEIHYNQNISNQAREKAEQSGALGRPEKIPPLLPSLSLLIIKYRNLNFSYL